MQTGCRDTSLIDDHGSDSPSRNGMFFPDTMKQLSFLVLALLPAAVAAGNAPVVEPVSEDIIQRLERIERRLNNQSLLDLYNQVQVLQSELQKLRGQLETQRHTLEEITQRQKDLYADIDQRLQKLEAGATGDGLGTDDDALADIDLDSDTAGDDEAIAGGPAADTGGQEDAAGDDAGVATDSGAARKAYNDAFDLLKSGKYEQAVTAFENYLNDYPGSEYADNARYWLGEANYVTGNFDKAISAYQQLLDEAPNSPKTPHAMLKIGYSQQELGKKDQAREMLERLRNEYPDTTAASLARERLQQMESAGG